MPFYLPCMPDSAYFDAVGAFHPIIFLVRLFQPFFHAPVFLLDNS